MTDANLVFTTTLCYGSVMIVVSSSICMIDYPRKRCAWGNMTSWIFTVWHYASMGPVSCLEWLKQELSNSVGWACYGHVTSLLFGK